MDIIQLRYFLKTAQTMNYTKAAEALFTSRQALRHTLDTLEKELGQPLFVNDHNRLSLTEYGEYLSRACVDALRTFDKMEADVTRFFRQEASVRFAYSVSLSPYTLPGLEQFVLRDFSAKFPRIILHTTACPAHEVIRLVERREVDCGCVLQMPTPRPGCQVTVLRTSPVTIDSGVGSPYRGRSEITLEELPQIPLIGMGELEAIAPPLWADCRRLGLKLNYTPVPNTIDALYLVRHGQASCLNTMPPQWTKNTKEPGAGQPRTLLRGYSWELVLLCPRDATNFHAGQLLASYIEDHYLHLYSVSGQNPTWEQDLATQEKRG